VGVAERREGSRRLDRHRSCGKSGEAAGRAQGSGSGGRNGEGDPARNGRVVKTRRVHAAVAELVSGSWLHATPKCTMLLDLGADSRSPGCAGSALTVSSLSDSVDPNLPSSKQSTNKVSSNSDLTKPSRVQDRPNQHRSTATCTLRARSSSRRSGGTSSTGGRC
jgi:hypothetical protein